MKTFIRKINIAGRFLLSLAAPCLVALALMAAFGCQELADALTEDAEAGKTTGSEEGSEDEGPAIESRGRNVEYVYMHQCEGTHKEDALSELMAIFTGRVVVTDPDKNYPIDWDNEGTIPDDYDPSDISGVKEEDGNPDDYDCVTETGDSDDAPTAETSLPEMDENWAGYGKGGCGTWATAVCNRILDESEGEVTQEEWNEIAGGINQNADGGSSMSDQSKYYEDKGYCVTEKKFGGSEADYQEMEEQSEDGCDVKLFFWTRNEDGSFTNGHTETVTEVDAESGSCTTNSWGEEATVSGGNDGDFDHSRDGDAFQDSEGNALWPEDATEVWVAYVCECSVLESIGKFLGL